MARAAWNIIGMLRLLMRSETKAVSRTTKKAERKGGAERPWDLIWEKPMLFTMVGRKTGMLLKATLQQKNMPAVRYDFGSLRVFKTSFHLNLRLCLGTFDCRAPLPFSEAVLTSSSRV